MREIVIISGKGGTGKTSIAGALAYLAESKVLCDMDVDAPDLHLLLTPEIQERHDFISGHEARIRSEDCTRCGQCAELCRFDAVLQTQDGYQVDPVRCEGCKVCVALCPAGAIDFPDSHCGEWFRSETRVGPMLHAQLKAGAENSGRLVTLLKQQARALAEDRGLELLLCDGAPGIGCPVISSLAGAHLALIVTEPTLSGLHDLKRVQELCRHFRIKTAVLVNKCDLNPEQTERIRARCAEQGCAVLAELPHDPLFVQAMVNRKTVTEYPATPTARALREAWERIATLAGLGTRPLSA